MLNTYICLIVAVTLLELKAFTLPKAKERLTISQSSLLNDLKIRFQKPKKKEKSEDDLIREKLGSFSSE